MFVPAPRWLDEIDGVENTNKVDAIQAKAVCNGTDGGGACPVIKQCLDYALEHDLWEGVWGGMTQKERRSESQRRRQASAEAEDRLARARALRG